MGDNHQQRALTAVLAVFLSLEVAEDIHHRTEEHNSLHASLERKHRLLCSVELPEMGKDNARRLEQAVLLVRYFLAISTEVEK